MSTIVIKCHDEDIHRIIKKPISPTIKSPRYKSKRKLVVKLEEQNAKARYNGHQTFGLAHYEAPKSSNFLKKGGPRIGVPAVKLLNKKEFKCTIDCKSSPVPKCSLDVSKHYKNEKNYIKDNIKKIKTIQPKKLCPRKVDTPRGTVKDLGHLLQMIKIRQSEEYGKIPKYLCKRRKQWAMEKKKKEEEQMAVEEYKKKMGIGSMGMNENVYRIDQETRLKLLDGLKENWNELSKQFLKLPVMSDTLPKIKRKVWLEREIDQLEKDVRLIERHPFIYLERNDLRPYEQIIAEEIKQRKIEKKEKEKERKEVEKEEENQINNVNKKHEKLDSGNTKQQTKFAVEEKKEDDIELNILNY